jgi:hypothetical protein
MSAAIDRVIDYTARKYESGSAGYSALNLNDAGAGISFGFIQFNQVKGDLPTLFKEMSAKAPSKFSAVFGSFAPRMLSDPWVRDTNLADDSDFIARLRASGAVPEFQAAQRAVAKKRFFDPIVAAVKAAGFKSERAFAMAYDTAVQRGPGTAVRLLKGSGGDLRAFATQADSVPAAGGRRTLMLQDPGLSDQELGVAAVGLGAALAVAGAVWFLTRTR